MIGNIYLNNILNFKDEFELSFEAKKREGIRSKTFKFGKTETILNNLNVIYGKNNVGKTNLLKSIGTISDIICYGATLNDLKTIMSRKNSNNVNQDNNKSEFEITVISDKAEYRYGVEYNEKKIVDEWLYAKIDNSSRETRLFDRINSFYSSKLMNYKILKTMVLKEDALLINNFNNLNDKLIDDFRSLLTNSIYISSHEDIVLRPEILDYIIDNPPLIDQISKALNAADTNIKNFKIKRFDDEYMDWFKEKIIKKGSSVADEDVEKLSKSGIPHFGFSDSKGEKSYSIDFFNDDDVSFAIHEVSFGTISFFNTIMTCIGWMGRENTILLIDEIEAGLHFELLLQVMGLINKNMNLDTQVIVATHAPIILDLEYIGNESKIFLRNENNRVQVDYASNYSLKKEHKISRRYELNVFGTSPKVI